MNAKIPGPAVGGDPPGSALMRLIDPRIPLPWLVMVIVMAVGLYNKVQALTEAVIELQIAVKAGNASWSGLASEQALLKFRATNTEGEVEKLKAAVTALQARR